ncbi:GFA family protein [Undibacterium sp. RuRC25W]|uniref:GFA family protein n=1 Tax=Undibacterium sp. RuRC25W TaxID=3413047 RepID=UPI003BF24ADE
MTYVTSEQPGLEGSCHCGAVRLMLPSIPETAIACNCSLCRRLGALWARYPFGSVRIEGHPEHTSNYVWGDKTLKTIRCNYCGCVTHWEPIDGELGTSHGINLRNFDLRLQEQVKVRYFDGADTWTFIDTE